MLTVAKTVMITTALAAVAAGVPLRAAVAPSDAAPTSASTDTTAEDIVVTAQKRAQSLLNVPLSVSVVSGEALERQNANTFADYLRLVSGLQLNQSTPGQSRLILRGINTGGVSSTVAVYIDETPFGSSTGLVNGSILAGDFETFDTARIEVLKGPQGTLYGASSLGGVLKFVTNVPQTDKLELRGRGGVEAVKGGDVSYYGNAVVNIPLGQTLAFRASGSYRNDSGFIDSTGIRRNSGTAASPAPYDSAASPNSRVQNNINGSRNYGGRASLLFTPSDKISLRLGAILQNIDADAPSVVESDPVTARTLYGRPTLSLFTPSLTHIAYRVYDLNANFDLGFATLTSISSYQTQKQTRRDDVSNDLSGLIETIFKTPNDLGLAQNTNLKKYNEEVRLSSTKIKLFDWTIGAYYSHEDGLIHQQYVPFQPGTLTRITTLPSLAIVDLNSTYEEIAGFGNATVHFGSRLNVDLGGRYSHNSQHAAQSASGALAGNVPINSNLRSSDDVFTFSAAPRFKLNDHASLYARVAKGYRPGGPNAIAPNAPADTPLTFAPDTVLSYEAGLKAETADRVFSFEVTAFHVDWKNIQLLTVINNFGVNINSPNGAKSDGVEFTASTHPLAGLALSVNGAYTNARLKGDTPPLVQGKKGERLPFSPDVSVGVNGDYSVDLSSATRGFVGASLRFLSKQPGDFNFRTPTGGQGYLPSYEVIDLRGGVEFSRFTLEAYVKNLENSDGKTSTSPLTANGLSNFPNRTLGTGIIRPRTVGLSLTAAY